MRLSQRWTLYAIGALVIAPICWIAVVLFLLGSGGVFDKYPLEMILGGWVFLAVFGAIYPRVSERFVPSWYEDAFVDPCERGLVLCAGTISGIAGFLIVLCLLFEFLFVKTGILGVLAVKVDD